MNHEYGHCINCGEEMSVIDDDPNGDHNATCARCRAQEAHDFDLHPNAEFSRLGELINNKPCSHADQSPGYALKASLQKIEQHSQRQDSTNNQLRDLRVFANRLGLYDAADVISKLLDKSLYICGSCRKPHLSFNTANACCHADHVECPLSDLPQNAEVGHGLEYNYAKGVFSANWEMVKNSRTDQQSAVAVFPLTQLMCKTLDLLASNSRDAGESAIKDAINRLLNER
jgi:hypothetical protein